MAPAAIFSVEGNIGTGKSTLLAELEKQFENHPDICYLKEPVDVWTSIKDKNGISILEKYYENQTRYAFPFQMMAFISRLSALRDALKRNYKVILMERSLYTDCNVFAKMLFDDEKIEDIEYAIYQKWFQDFIQELPPISFIYLQNDPIISAKRVEKRGRQGENTIPLAYLENCHKYHEEWLFKNNTRPLLVLDANVDIMDNPEILQKWFAQIKSFINEPTGIFEQKSLYSLNDIAYYIQNMIF